MRGFLFIKGLRSLTKCYNEIANMPSKIQNKDNESKNLCKKYIQKDCYLDPL